MFGGWTSFQLSKLNFKFQLKKRSPGAWGRRFSGTKNMDIDLERYMPLTVRGKLAP